MKKLLILIPFLSFGQTPKWITELENSTEQDKAKHYWVSAIGTTILSTSINHYIDRPTLSSWAGGVIMFGVGAGKEYIWDGKMKRGVKNGGDLFMDFWGCFTGMAMGRVVIDLQERKKDKLNKEYYEY